MHTGPIQGDASSEVAALVRSCLERLDTLADGYIEELGSIEGYGHVNVPPEDIRETTRDALELILRKAAGMPLNDRLTSVSEAIGRRRAIQAVPLEVLMQAVRMVFRLLWTSLHARATERQRDALEKSAVQLWEAIEFHTVRVHAGYLDEVSRMRRDHETEVTILLSDFLGRNRADPALTLRVGRTLGLGVEERFLVAAAAGEALTKVRSRLTTANGRAQVHPRGDAVMVLVPAPQPADLTPTWADGIPVALAPVVGDLAGVPAAWRIAHGLLIATPPGSHTPRTLSEGWPYLIDTMLPDLAETVRADAIGELRALTPESRRQICATTETYMRTGSLLEASRQLYCHRNTVLKRLSRFRELTGLDPAVPWHAATIRLALSVIDRDPPASGAGGAGRA